MNRAFQEVLAEVQARRELAVSLSVLMRRACALVEDPTDGARSRIAPSHLRYLAEESAAWVKELGCLVRLLEEAGREPKQLPGDLD